MQGQDCHLVGIIKQQMWSMYLAGTLLLSFYSILFPCFYLFNFLFLPFFFCYLYFIHKTKKTVHTYIHGTSVNSVCFAAGNDLIILIDKIALLWGYFLYFLKSVIIRYKLYRTFHILKNILKNKINKMNISLYKFNHTH